MAAHACTLEPRTRFEGRRRLPEFRAKCSCGWASEWLSVAGMAHGAEASHIEGVVA